MFFDHSKDLSEEELEEKRIAKENAKRSILSRMRDRRIVKRELLAAEQQEAEEQQEREEAQKPKKIIIKNLRWEHSDNEVKDKRPDFVIVGDNITLHADVENGDGNSAVFELHDNNIPQNIDPEKLVVDKTSSVESGACSVEWTVADPRSKKDPDREIDLYFLVKIKDVFSDNCEIPIGEDDTKPFILSI